MGRRTCDAPQIYCWISTGVVGIGSTVSAVTFPDLIVLPGATSTEGIATGAGSTFYAGDLFAGDIFRGDLNSGEAELFIDAPSGRAALGLKADVANDLLFVAGGFTGQAYVYDLTTGATSPLMTWASSSTMWW